MQAYDLIMLIVLCLATIFGAIKGFAWQAASLASIIISYLVAYRFRFQVAEMIHAAPPWNVFLAMLILYIGTSFVIWVVLRLLSGAIDRVRLKEFDRHIGAAFGLGKGLIYCLLITMFAMSLLGPEQQNAICQSRSGYYIASALDKGVGILPREIHDVVGPYLTQLDAKLRDGQNGLIRSDVGSSGWISGLPEMPGSDVQSVPKKGDGWNLGQLIPNLFQGPPLEQPGQPVFGKDDGRDNFGAQSNFTPNFPPLVNTGDQILPPPGSFAPSANGLGYDNYDSQSAQQPGYVLPR